MPTGGGLFLSIAATAAGVATGAVVTGGLTTAVGAGKVVPRGNRPADKADCSCGLLLIDSARTLTGVVRYSWARLLPPLRNFSIAVFSWAVVATGIRVFNL